MKISVVIPAYNSQDTIGRAIESIFKQSRPVDEILVVDDGSTDNTASVVRDFGQAVTLMRQDNAGVSVARNTGIQAAKGNWIAFLDADDEWLPEKIKLQTEHLNQTSSVQWTYSNFCCKQSASKPVSIAHQSPSLTELMAGQTFADYFTAYTHGAWAWTSTIVIAREVFDTVGLFEPGMKRGQDNDLWFRIAYQYPQVGYLPAPLAVYHQDTPGSSTKINDSVEFMTALVQRHETLSRRHHRYDAFRPCIEQMLEVWITQCFHHHRFRDAQTLADTLNDYLKKRFKREIRFRLLYPPIMSPLANWILHCIGKAPKAQA